MQILYICVHRGAFMKTTRYAVTSVKSGMILAEDVYNSSDQLVLNAGTVLTDRSITRLKFYSIHEVLIDTSPAKTEVKTRIRPSDVPTYTERVKRSEDYRTFAKSYKSTLDLFQNRISQFTLTRKGLNAQELLDSVKQTFSTAETTGKIFDMLMCIRSLDDITFVHGMNVALISMLFGQWLGYSKEDCEVLMLAGLLHDIGKLKIPPEILKKKGSLTSEEFDIIKSHPLEGYNLLKDQNLDDRVVVSALQHHERCDGTGYPNGLKGAHIHDFAKIISIADVYDAMTASRCYRGPICPLEVLNAFESEGLSKYDPKFLLTFMDKVVSTYLHQYVLLNNGNVGEIVMINKHSPARPIIRMLNSECLDLSRERSISIVGIV